MNSRDMSLLRDKAPELANISEKAEKILKAHKMSGHEAHVALCLDISGTMRQHYTSGKLQRFAEEIMALSAQFDDDSTIDVFLFGEATYFVGQMSPNNFEDFIKDAHKKYVSVGGTYYAKAIKRVRDFYFPHTGKGERSEIVTAKRPAYVMVVSDGSTVDEEETVQQLVWASYEPIFWQFMALGEGKNDQAQGFWGWLKKPFLEDFSFLEKIDSMGGRKVDNVGFFNHSDPLSLPEEQLFELLLKEYPDWIQKAQKLGMF